MQLPSAEFAMMLCNSILLARQIYTQLGQIISTRVFSSLLCIQALHLCSPVIIQSANAAITFPEEEAALMAVLLAVEWVWV